MVTSCGEIELILTLQAVEVTEHQTSVQLNSHAFSFGVITRVVTLLPNDVTALPLLPFRPKSKQLFTVVTALVTARESKE